MLLAAGILTLSLLLAQDPPPALKEAWTVSHSSMATAAATSPDSRRTLVGLDDGRILSYVLETGEEQPLAFRFYAAVSDLAYAPDGKSIAVGNRYGQLYVVDTSTWKILASVKSPSVFNRLRYSTDGSHLYAGRMDGHLLRMNSGDLKIDGDVVPNATSLVLGCVCAPDGRSLATADREGKIYLWTPDLAPIRTWKAHEKAVYALAYDAASRLLASGGEDHALKVWDQERKVQDSADVHHEGIKSLAFAPDGRLVSGGQDGLCQFWEPGTFKPGRSFPGYRGFISCLSITPDGRWLVRAGSMLEVVPMDHPERPARLKQFGGAIISLTGNSGGRLWVTGSLDHSAMVWSYEKALTSRALPLDDWPAALALSSDSTLFAVGREDGWIDLYEMNGLSRKARFRAHDRPVTFVAFNKESSRILSGGGDGRVVAHDLSGALMSEVALRSAVVAGVVESSGGYVVAGTSSGEAELCDLENRSIVGSLPGRPFTVTSMAISRDGAQVAVGYFDGAIVLWHLVDRKKVAFAPGTGSSALSLDFSPSGSRLVAGFRDGRIEVLAASGMDVLSQGRSPSEVFGARFAWDESTIVTAGADHALTLRSLDEPAVAKFKPGVGRFLSAAAEKMARKDYAGAVDEFTLALERDPESAPAYLGRGQANLELKDYASSIADLTEAIARNAGSAQTYKARGDAHRFLGAQDSDELRAAVEDYGKALELDPAFVDAHFARALARIELTEFLDAIQDLTKVLKVRPKDAQAYSERGRARGGFGDFEAALEDFAQALQLEPGNASAYFNRAAVRSAQEDPEAAIKDLSAAIRIRPDYEEAYLTRAGILESKLDYAGAIQDYGKIIQIHPDNGQAYSSRGYAAYYTGAHDQALGDFAKAAELGTEFRDYDELFAWIIRSKKKTRELADRGLGEYLKARESAEGEWYVKLAQYLIGEVTEKDLLETAQSSDEPVRANQSSEAMFYSGMKRLLDGYRDTACERLDQCLELDLKDFIEYRAAAVERKQLK